MSARSSAIILYNASDYTTQPFRLYKSTINYIIYKMGNCQQCCTPSPSQHQFPQSTSNSYTAYPPAPASAHRVQSPPSLISGQQILLRCQICGEDRKDSMLKEHLDICHFAQVKQISSNQFQVICLLCEFKSLTLQHHKNHLMAKHPYMENQSRINSAQELGGSRTQTNQHLKHRLTLVSKLDIYMQPDGKSAEIAGVLFDVYGYQNQYGAMEYNEDIAKGDLVWRYIFSELQDASFYFVQFVPKQKTIQGISKIFIKRRLG